MSKSASGWHLLAVWMSVIWAFSFWCNCRTLLSPVLSWIPALKVHAREGETQVILPADSVHMQGERAYVWLAQGGLARKLWVQATAWRENFWRVDGVPSAAVVLLGDVSLASDNLSYRLINPEAGQSGVER